METSLIEFMTKGLDLPQMDPKAFTPWARLHRR